MKTLNFIIVILLVALSVSLYVSIKQTDKLQDENSRLSGNLAQYGTSLSTLTLTNAEIEAELMKRETALTEADSILRSRNRKISQLEEYIRTSVKIRDTTIVYVPLPVHDTIITDAGLMYKSKFTHTQSCITVSGFILSSDPDPSLAITERSADIVVYDIYIRRKWYQIFRPKFERIVETNCGEVEIKKIIK
jgi:hypothetical protein